MEKKALKKKYDNYMSSRKFTIIHLIAKLIKKTCIQVSQYFPKPYGQSGIIINDGLDLSTYPAKII